MRRLARLPAEVWLAAALLVTGCEDDDKPTPPDVSALRAAYAAPTATIDDSTAAAVALALDARLSDDGALCGWTGIEELRCMPGVACPLRGCEGISAVLGVLDLFRALRGDAGMPDAGDAIDAGSADAGPPVLEGVVLTGDGFVRVRRICPGAGVEPSPDPANGHVEVVVGFSDRGLDPVVWGDAVSCDVRVLDTPARISGRVVVVLGDGPWKTPDALAPIFQLDVTVTAAGTTVTVTADFRLDLARSEYVLALALEDGTRAMFFANADASGYRAANGEWTCDFWGMTCTNGSGGSVSW